MMADHSVGTGWPATTAGQMETRHMGQRQNGSRHGQVITAFHLPYC